MATVVLVSGVLAVAALALALSALVYRSRRLAAVAAINLVIWAALAAGLFALGESRYDDCRAEVARIGEAERALMNVRGESLPDCEARRANPFE